MEVQAAIGPSWGHINSAGQTPDSPQPRQNALKHTAMCSMETQSPFSTLDLEAPICDSIISVPLWTLQTTGLSLHCIHNETRALPANSPLTTHSSPQPNQFSRPSKTNRAAWPLTQATETTHISCSLGLLLRINCSRRWPQSRLVNALDNQGSWIFCFATQGAPIERA